jgi:hypothetical protein
VRHQACVRFAEGVVQLPQHIDPNLDVLPLRLTHLPLGRRREMTEIAILNPDQV